MKPISDKDNARGVYIIFAVIQMILLALMYSVVYTSYKITEVCIERYELNAIMAYAPTIIVFIAIPLVLYKTRSIFLQERRMVAISWMMALLSIFLVGLMLHMNNISGTA
ncbi:hypothetical protein MNB_SV-13-661 [hydrothermal vent metagenome]|uniref:Uncharacterized protein n=1 Tax=hydrothermal vent metagenome TaxID=652676 RepID=A0A1W1CS64_9ZZZZ